MFTLKVLDVSQDLIHSINVFVEVLRRGLEQGFHGIRFTRTQQGGQNAELRTPLGQRPGLRGTGWQPYPLGIQRIRKIMQNSSNLLRFGIQPTSLNGG